MRQAGAQDRRGAHEVRTERDVLPGSSRKFERFALCPSKSGNEIADHDQRAPTAAPVAVHINCLGCVPASSVTGHFFFPSAAVAACRRTGGVAERKLEEEGYGSEEVEQRGCGEIWRRRPQPVKTGRGAPAGCEGVTRVTRGRGIHTQPNTHPPECRSAPLAKARKGEELSKAGRRNSSAQLPMPFTARAQSSPVVNPHHSRDARGIISMGQFCSTISQSSLMLTTAKTPLSFRDIRSSSPRLPHHARS
jgi:hypothetical protein